jgi:hypothetical protein
MSLELLLLGECARSLESVEDRLLLGGGPWTVVEGTATGLEVGFPHGLAVIRGLKKGWKGGTRSWKGWPKLVV